jgi:hypothetical protein
VKQPSELETIYKMEMSQILSSLLETKHLKSQLLEKKITDTELDF